MEDQEQNMVLPREIMPTAPKHRKLAGVEFIEKAKMRNLRSQLVYSLSGPYLFTPSLARHTRHSNTYIIKTNFEHCMT